MTKSLRDLGVSLRCAARPSNVALPAQRLAANPPADRTSIVTCRQRDSAGTPVRNRCRDPTKCEPSARTDRRPDRGNRRRRRGAHCDGHPWRRRTHRFVAGPSGRGRERGEPEVTERRRSAGLASAGLATKRPTRASSTRLGKPDTRLDSGRHRRTANRPACRDPAGTSRCCARTTRACDGWLLLRRQPRACRIGVVAVVRQPAPLAAESRHCPPPDTQVVPRHSTAPLWHETSCLIKSGIAAYSRLSDWERWGVTVADPDGYRLVLSDRSWP